MWVGIAVCELVAMNLSSFAVSVGLQPFIFARIVGSKPLLFGLGVAKAEILAK
jgi:hypothetical protein